MYKYNLLLKKVIYLIAIQLMFVLFNTLFINPTHISQGGSHKIPEKLSPA